MRVLEGNSYTNFKIGMVGMKKISTELPEVYIIEPQVLVTIVAGLWKPGLKRNLKN